MATTKINMTEIKRTNRIESIREMMKHCRLTDENGNVIIGGDGCKKYRPLTKDSDDGSHSFNGDKDEWEMYTNACDYYLKSLYSNNYTTETRNKYLTDIMLLLGCTDDEIKAMLNKKNVHKDLAKFSAKNSQTLSKDARDKRKDLEQEKSDIVNMTIDEVKDLMNEERDTPVVFSNEAAEDYRKGEIKRINDEIREIVEGANYSTFELTRVSIASFKKNLEAYLGGVKLSTFTSLYDKKMARLNERLAKGEISQKKYEQRVAAIEKRYGEHNMGTIETVTLEESK